MKRNRGKYPFTLGHYVLSLWLVAFGLAMYFLPDEYTWVATGILFPGVLVSMFIIPEDKQ